MRNKRITNEEFYKFEDYIYKRYYHENKTISEIALEIKCSPWKIYKLFEERGWTRKKRTSITQEKINKVLDMYSDPYESIDGIARKLKMDDRTVAKILDENNIKRRLPKMSRREDLYSNTQYTKGEILDHLEKCNYKYCETARHFNIRHQCVVSLAKTFNVHVPFETYDYNTEFFKKIDSHEKAFIMGLILTDGSIAKNGFSICLQDLDKEILDKIIRMLSSDKELYYISKTKGRPMYMMNICNVEMKRDLEKLGLMQNKTFKLTVQPWMTGEFRNSVILGMLAGDGALTRYVCRTKNGKPMKRWRFEFIGINPMCEYIVETLRKDLGIHCSIKERYTYPDNPEKVTISAIQVSGNYQVKRLLDYLHKDSTLFLKRKYDIYMELVEFLRQREFGTDEQSIKSRDKCRNVKTYENEIPEILS